MKMELILYNYCNLLEGACFSRNFFPTGSPRVETVCASLADALPPSKIKYSSACAIFTVTVRI